LAEILTILEEADRITGEQRHHVLANLKAL
jgi:hypothetical protein